MDMQDQFAHNCRTCMNKPDYSNSTGLVNYQDHVHSIYEYPSKNYAMTIEELLVKTTPQLIIQTDDNLPKIICNSCLQRLVHVYEFQQMCMESDIQMRSQLENDVELKFSQMQEIPTTLTMADVCGGIATGESSPEDPLKSNDSEHTEKVNALIKLEVTEQSVLPEQNNRCNYDATFVIKENNGRENYKLHKTDKYIIKNITDDMEEEVQITAVSNVIANSYNLDYCKCEKYQMREECMCCEIRPVHSDQMDNYTNKHLYRCKYCEHDFADAHDLAVHLDLWHRENVFKCEFCSLEFGLGSDLSKHLVVHTNFDHEMKEQRCKNIYASDAQLKENSAPVSSEHLQQNNDIQYINLSKVSQVRQSTEADDRRAIAEILEEVSPLNVQIRKR